MKILIVDDHVLIRKGIISILMKNLPDITVEETDNVANVPQLMHEGRFDVVLMDVNVNGINGLDTLKQIRQFDNATAIVMLSLQSDDHYALRALKAGADGYLDKNSTPQELIYALNSVINGKKYISERQAERLASFMHSRNRSLSHESLSDREFDVLRLIATGKQVSQIANDLHLSVPTISTYRSRILNKMGMKNNAELTHYAISNKLV